MKINFFVNEQKLSIDEDCDLSLLEVLRKENFLSVKRGCGIEANCGACAVLLDGKCVFSCLVPCGILNGANVTTLEHFSKTAAYQEIAKGFEKAGVSLCGFCNAGKIFSAYEIITQFSNPTRSQIYSRISALKECCAERDALANGIVYASQIHFEKESQRQNARH